MFENDLKEKLKEIFVVTKVSFNQPSESAEQGVLFVEVEESRNQVKDNRFHAKVRGKLQLFGKNNELPFGYFSTKIASADHATVKDFFFFDFEENDRRYQNLVQRSVSFIFFFNCDYDPSDGTITSIEFPQED